MSWGAVNVSGEPFLDFTVFATPWFSEAPAAGNSSPISCMRAISFRRKTRMRSFDALNDFADKGDPGT